MAWRYKQHGPQSGDAIVPSDWELNHKEMASEFNGYLDRDNFRENIFSVNGGIHNDSSPLIKDNTFNEFFHSNFYSDYGKKFTTFGGSTAGWHPDGYEDASDTRQNYSKINIDLPVEALLICEFNCWFQWNPRELLDGTDHRWDPEDTSGDLNHLAMPDSNDAGRGGFGNEHHADIIANSNTAKKNQVYKNGYGWFQVNSKSASKGTEQAMYDGAAMYEPEVYQDSEKRDNAWVQEATAVRNAFITGPMPLYAGCAFRIAVDGVVVSESGWFSDHRKKESVYLVGAIPLQAGPHTVQVEVRKSFVANDKPGTVVSGMEKPVVMFDRQLIAHARYR